MKVFIKYMGKLHVSQTSSTFENNIPITCNIPSITATKLTSFSLGLSVRWFKIKEITILKIYYCMCHVSQTNTFNKLWYHMLLILDNILNYSTLLNFFAYFHSAPPPSFMLQRFHLHQPTDHCDQLCAGGTNSWFMYMSERASNWR
jgi:hypothetical protein